MGGPGLGGLLMACALLAAMPANSAEPAANPRSGERLARLWCAECHLVAEDQKRPVVVGVPTFRGLANDPAVGEYRIRMFLITPHPVMPNFMLTAQETEDIVAYFRSLKVKP
jgi:mono/diheme cytochrome c family protein